MVSGTLLPAWMIRDWRAGIAFAEPYDARAMADFGGNMSNMAEYRRLPF